MFTHDNYEGYHREQPDRKVSVEAFSDRGARLKVRRLLASLRVITMQADLKEFVVVRK